MAAENSRLYLWFILIYPVVFFPGSLFYTPDFVGPATAIAASEQDLYLPKLFVLILISVLGMVNINGRVKGSPFVYLLAGYLVLAVASTVNARDSLTFGLLGGPLRFDGIVYQFALVGIGIYCFQVSREYFSIRNFGVALMGSGLIQSVIVIFQRLGFDPLTRLRQYSGFDQVGGTLGHPGFVASLLLPTLIFGLFFSLGERRGKFWICSAVVIGIALGIAGNSASLLSLIFTLVILNFTSRSRKAILYSLLIVLSVIIPRNVLPNKIGFQTNFKDSSTLYTRFKIWKIAAVSLSESPFHSLIGGGPDGFRLSQLRNPPLAELAEFCQLEYGWPNNIIISKTSIKSFPGEGFRSNWVEFEFSKFGLETNVKKQYGFGLDRAHNFILDRWISYGLPSAIVWLVLYMYPTIIGLRGKDPTSRLLSLVLTSIFIYYMAWFSTMQVEPLHFLLVAIAWANLYRKPINEMEVTGS